MNTKGQAFVELAIFGALILFALGVWLSHAQRMNDQQYAEMETFRRALQKACTYQGETSEGAGASVQYTMLQNRRHVDLSSGFKKGSPSSTGYSSNVFWAIPKVGSQAESLIVYKINDDEKAWNYRDFVSKAEDATQSFRVEDTNTQTSTKFSEEIEKRETPAKIANTKKSTLEDTIDTTITYTIRGKDTDDNPDNDVIIEGPKDLWSLKQGLYRDAQGQYRYSADRVGNEVVRGRSWVTEN